MSAIFGLIHLDKRPVAPEELAGMNAALAMHGRDGSGQWQHEAVGLGQRLRRLTPEDRFERQPQISSDGQIHLVSDGRIDNRPEMLDALRVDLAPAEVADSLLILRAYERWGEECVHQLIGTFTFALWDARYQRLLIVRSAIDSPSLFFQATSRTLAFATMPKGLFALPFIARTLDEQYLAQHLVRASNEPEATFYSNIKRLLPGQMLVVQGKAWTVENFWKADLTRRIHFRRDEEYVEAFGELLERVIRDHLRSLTPVGVMMSGGLDSTTVAAVAAQFYRAMDRRLATFTEVPRAGFAGAIIEGRYADETAYVQAMARYHSNLDTNLIRTDGEVYLSELDSFFAAAETPFPNASNRPWYEAILCAAQAQGIHLLLTGNRGNLSISWRGEALLAQLVGEGRWAQAWQEAQALTRRANALSTLRLFLMRGILPYLPSWAYLAANRVRALNGSDSESLTNWHHYAPINPAFAAEHKIDEHLRVKRGQPYSPSLRTPNVVRLRGIVSSVRRGDGLEAGYAALYGVTTCDPTADIRLVEFCLALPEGQYQRHGASRWLLRRAMAERLPSEVLENHRRGLQAADWYERLYHSRGRILDELAHIEQCDLARRALDLPRLRSLVEGMQVDATNAKTQLATYRGLLERGLMTGSFIRWIEGGK